ncbi:hypothetical protein SLEP1_g14528 [Rubroshorea leprosula]|uniref:Uncharacterized protein n=1 Tax=Rubroshorea leprosula TaxID=152421 RepID=A0AAV5IJG0_9ROSI|nr:hypothetical protein SLEP1_g14528 [Rubroshorea leprosula]
MFPRTERNPCRKPGSLQNLTKASTFVHSFLRALR